MTTERRLRLLETPSAWWHSMRRARRALLVGPALSLLGCNELTGGQPLPSGTPDPSVFNTPAGAIEMRNAAISVLENAIPMYIRDAGLLTDEFQSNQVGNLSPGQLLTTTFPSGGIIDERILPEFLSVGGNGPADEDYAILQSVRAYVNQALGALATYDPAAPPAVRGELYALEGYAEILLADFFCSGVPLSTLNYQQDFTYRASSSTAQVYADAIAKEDTALALSSDSARIMNLASVLKGRALLAMGSFAAAAQAVASVPPNFQYQLAFQAVPGVGGNTQDLFLCCATVSDREGETGLPYISSNDPRVQTIQVQTVLSGINTPVTLNFPARYSLTGFSAFTVGDWIEAQLIQAEAQLQPANAPSGPWLLTLNQLRESIGLSDTTDPGTDTARVSLLFRERAFWLFATGHRQGDLRRLIRQYGRSQVYPTGIYLGGGTGVYGSDITAPIPGAEYANPLFNGCINRGA